MTMNEQAPAPDVCDAEVPWPPQGATISADDVKGFAWTMTMQSSQIRALLETGEMQHEQIVALKARVTALAEERDALKALIEHDPRRTATVGGAAAEAVAPAKNGARGR